MELFWVLGPKVEKIAFLGKNKVASRNPSSCIRKKLIKQKSLVPMSYTLSVPKLLLQINLYKKLIKAKKIVQSEFELFCSDFNT